MNTTPAILVIGPYVMDPETEDLIYGDELRENMIILVESQLCRHDVIAPDIFAQRWCKVTRLRTTSSHVQFTGIYADGSKATRMYNVNHGWFVKKASLQ